jgi:predicted O-methyltransferase YrrM
VIYAPDRDPEQLLAALGDALATAGVGSDGGPDMAALPLPRDPKVEAFLARRAHAVLSNRDPAAGERFASGLRVFRAAGVDALRSLAEQLWERPDRELWVAEPLHEGVVNRSPLGHFYSPVPDTRELAVEPRRSQVWPARPRVPAGIDWRAAEQERLCGDVFGAQERLEFRAEPSDDPTEYFTQNDQFPALDGWLLEAMLRWLRPRRMIEVGCGFSSLVSARVNREQLGGAMEFTCIEPYPRDFLIAGVEGISDVVVDKIQDAPLALFDRLGAGDVLFIDTSHTVKTGNDVTWLFHEVVPRLAPGVVVHVHDIFLPCDYPQKWVFEGWGWNEQYLLQSFLAFNSAFEILVGAQWMLQRSLPALLAGFPGMAERRHAERSGVSFWMRRVD